MDDTSAGEYLRRIGAGRPARPDAAALRELHRRHLVAVPFENLSIHLGEEVVLAEQPLFEKIVRARRGGFCYELNGMFAALLEALGYSVTRHAARVNLGKTLGVPFDHLALRVGTVDGSVWLADVGFGKHSEYPLRLEERGEQQDPGGVFRLIDAAEGDLDVFQDGAPQYRMELRPRTLAEFEIGRWWNTTSPKSHFTRSLVCSRLTEDGGRVTLSGRTLVTTTAGGGRREAELEPEGVLPAYREHFGIELEREPIVTSAAADACATVSGAS